MVLNHLFTGSAVEIKIKQKPEELEIFTAGLGQDVFTCIEKTVSFTGKHRRERQSLCKTISCICKFTDLSPHKKSKENKQTEKKKKTPQVAAAGKYILIYRNGYAQKYIHIPTVALFLTQGCACL